MYKKRGIIIIFLIIALLALVICLSIIKNAKHERVAEGKVGYTDEDIKLIHEGIQEFYEDKITPIGLSTLYGKYKGNNDFRELYKSFYVFVNYLPAIVEQKMYDMDEAGIASYYESNKDAITYNLGIKSSQEFVGFVRYLKDKGYNGQEFKTCEVMSTEKRTEEGYYIFDVGFNFNGIENPIVFTISFSNAKSTIPMVIYTPANQ